MLVIHQNVMIRTGVSIFVILGTMQTCAHSDVSDVLSDVCQHCNSWCSAHQSVMLEPRAGKSGPRGPPGPIGRPGVVNMSAIEELIDRKIAAALGFISSTGGGNWTVFQRRMDGSVDFYRDWTGYVNGFGKRNGEFWLGLEEIHRRTKNRNIELRIDMIGRDGMHYFAKYYSFKIGPASDNYRLSVSGYSGNATDSFANPSTHKAVLNNQQFSTKDRDNDQWMSSNCAETDKAGWWFNSCSYSSLNGLYDELNGWSGITWYFQTNGSILHMQFTEMKFREKH